MADYRMVSVLQTLLSLLWLLQLNLLLLYSHREQQTVMENNIRHMLLDPPRSRTRRAARRRFWVRPGRTSSWWDNLVNGVVVDDEWRETFPMSRASVVALSEELWPHIEGRTTNMRAPIDPLKKVALTLYYLSDAGRPRRAADAGRLRRAADAGRLRRAADAGRLRRAADAFGVSRQAVSVIVRQTCRAISTHLGPKYIRLPFTEAEAEALVAGFQRAHGMPRCFGAVDGTHMEIKPPSTNATDYMNRRGQHSLNVQAVCDYKGRFMDVVIKWPGSVPDGRVFVNSRINQYFQTGRIPAVKQRLVEEEAAIPTVLLGDAAYPLLPYLMKEYPDGGSTPQEQYFGTCLCRARTVIEGALGRLKARFAALRRPLDINLDDLPHVIYSCFVLHNFCEASKEAVDEERVLGAIEGERASQPPTRSDSSITDCSEEGERVRSVILRYLETHRRRGL